MKNFEANGFKQTTETASFQRLYDDYISKLLKSKDFSDLMDPMIEQIDEDQVVSINESFLFYSDCKYGYRELVDLLANTLGVETPRLYFKMVQEGERSKYPPAIYDNKKKCIGIVLSDDESYLGTGKIIGAVRKIAHEMWHVYQQSEIDRHGERASLYRNNFDNYICANRNSSYENILTYLEQPIEAEAYAFGEKFTLNFLEKLINSLSRERDDFVGKTALSNYDINQDDMNEGFFDSEHELKMDQLKKLQRIYNNSRAARLANK